MKITTELSIHTQRFYTVNGAWTMHWHLFGDRITLKMKSWQLWSMRAYHFLHFQNCFAKVKSENLIHFRQWTDLTPSKSIVRTNNRFLNWPIAAVQPTTNGPGWCYQLWLAGDLWLINKGLHWMALSSVVNKQGMQSSVKNGFPLTRHHRGIGNQGGHGLNLLVRKRVQMLYWLNADAVLTACINKEAGGRRGGLLVWGMTVLECGIQWSKVC